MARDSVLCGFTSIFIQWSLPRKKVTYARFAQRDFVARDGNETIGMGRKGEDRLLRRHKKRCRDQPPPEKCLCLWFEKLAAALSDEELSKRTALRVDCGVVTDCPIRSFGKT